jgi:hypothetical protein
MQTMLWASKIEPSAPTTCLVALGLAMAGSTASFAYRPFDGTDAAVADPQEVEIELEPAGVLRQDSQKSLIAPFMTFNYGFAKDWEFVFQGQSQFPLRNSDQNASTNGVGAFLKHVLREGSLQDARGPSVAIEFGPLLPGVDGIVVSVRASVRSCPSGGTGERCTRTSSPNSRATIALTTFLAALLKAP